MVMAEARLRVIEGVERSTTEKQSTCFSQFFNAALEANNLEEAETLCRRHLNDDLSSCLRALAPGWADRNDQYAVTLCNELDIDNTRHSNCLLDLALATASRSRERALEICNQLPSDEAELCRQEVADRGEAPQGRGSERFLQWSHR
jgi:hypothetical protein